MKADGAEDEGRTFSGSISRDDDEDGRVEAHFLRDSSDSHCI
jgi:hypothetical protein